MLRRRGIPAAAAAGCVVAGARRSAPGARRSVPGAAMVAADIAARPALAGAVGAAAGLTPGAAEVAGAEALEAAALAGASGARGGAAGFVARDAAREAADAALAGAALLGSVAAALIARWICDVEAGSAWGNSGTLAAAAPSDGASDSFSSALKTFEQRPQRTYPCPTRRSLALTASVSVHLGQTVNMPAVAPPVIVGCRRAPPNPRAVRSAAYQTTDQTPPPLRPAPPRAAPPAAASRPSPACSQNQRRAV